MYTHVVKYSKSSFELCDQERSSPYTPYSLAEPRPVQRMTQDNITQNGMPDRQTHSVPETDSMR